MGFLNLGTSPDLTKKLLIFSQELVKMRLYTKFEPPSHLSAKVMRPKACVVNTT